MATNFDFLKSVDKNLYEIITDAEKLYKDEYFEQCMGQTRRFGESICKVVLGSKYLGEYKFDEMLATLKDRAKGSEQEKEFLDDLYFLKQQGNKTLHSSKVSQDGVTALECLQRAFEVAINYCVYHKGKGAEVLKLHYDVELLVTGTKNKTLAQRYSQKKQKTIVETKKQPVKSTVKAVKKPLKKGVKKVSKKSKKKKKVKQGLSFFAKFILFMFCIALLIIGGLIILLGF